MRYSYEDTTRIPKERIATVSKRLSEYRETIATLEPKTYAMPEAGIAASVDGVHMEAALRLFEELGPVRHVILIGIGGSSLGTEAVFGALRTADSPQLHVFDIADTSRIVRLANELQGVALTDIVVIIVSKSGTTSETVANSSVLMAELTKMYGDTICERVIAIGDKRTPLEAAVHEAKYHYAPMPSGVGGRFSVFTVVGLVPLAFLGIDIRNFVSGAHTRVRAQRDSYEAADAAAVTYVAREQGMHTHLLFAEDERFIQLMRWNEQLIAESLGKERTKSATPFKGPLAPHTMTPRELHSTAQLYLSGFSGVFTTFCGSAKRGEEHSYLIANEGIGSLLKMSEPRQYDRVPQAIMVGVKTAYRERGLPHASVELDMVTPEEVGSFLVERMIEVVYLAELWDIDAFGQPHVELYKKETRKLLGN